MTWVNDEVGEASILELHPAHATLVFEANAVEALPKCQQI
jgi:hypothetical protein